MALFKLAGRGSVRLEVSAMDHQLLRRPGFGREGGENALEHPYPTSTYEPVIERFIRPVAVGRILPLQAVADHVDDLADHAAVVNAWNAARQREEWLDALHLSG